MKKQAVKQVRASREDVGHLNETLTDLTTTTARGLRKWWKPAVVVLVIAVAVQVAYFLLGAMAERERRRLNQELHELFPGAAVRKEGYLPDPVRVDVLLHDIKGKPEEKPMVAKAVAFYLEAAREAKDEALRDGNLERGRELARALAERYPADTDLKQWAATVESRVEGEKKKAWLKDRRTYRPPVPGAGGQSAAGAGTPGDPAPAPGSPSAGTPGDPAPGSPNAGTPKDPAPGSPSDPAPAPGSPEAGAPPAAGAGNSSPPAGDGNPSTRPPAASGGEQEKTK